MNIVTEFPFWFVIFCLLTGILYAIILYYKDRKNEFSPWILISMAFFRFLSVSLISFLLLSPLLKIIIRHTEKPIIIFAQDNSRSILTGKDSLFYKNEYFGNSKELIDNLKKNYDVKYYSFGDNISRIIDSSYSSKQTNFSILFDELITRYSNRNVGTIIIASDGIFNKGLNPVYAAKKISFPIYTIALGDTNIQKDIKLTKVNYNRIAYLKNKFPLEIIINAEKCKGEKCKLIITKGNEELFSRNINITGNDFIQTVLTQIEAKETGLQHYTVRLTNLEDEISYSNNVQEIFIDIIDSKQKILILANSPHPDIAALKFAIEDKKSYQVEDYLYNDFKKQVTGYNLLILHQLPSFKNSLSDLFFSINKAKIPLLFIIGVQTDLNTFNKLNTGLSIWSEKNTFNEALPIINKEFVLFSISTDLKKIIGKLPPLNSPFGRYKMLNSTNQLFNQKIGSVETRNPLILFNQNQDLKFGVIAGDGIWKWRLTNYFIEENHNAFNELVHKTIQYLSVKEDKSYFRVFGKNDFPENENVEFNAELYNESYELINHPEVEITIINDKGKKYPFVFSKTGNSYHLDAGSFPVGTYQYLAITKVGNKTYKSNGEFIISALNIETVNTIADHNLLFRLAKSKDGEMVYPSQMNDIFDLINEREDIKTIVYTQKRFEELINIKWVLILIIVLLTAEWFMRKRSGAY